MWPFDVINLGNKSNFMSRLFSIKKKNLKSWQEMKKKPKDCKPLECNLNQLITFSLESSIKGLWCSQCARSLRFLMTFLAKGISSQEICAFWRQRNWKESHITLKGITKAIQNPRNVVVVAISVFQNEILIKRFNCKFFFNFKFLFFNNLNSPS